MTCTEDYVLSHIRTEERLNCVFVKKNNEIEKQHFTGKFKN